MKTRHKRLAIIVTGVVGLTVAGLFVLNAFRSNLVFFYSPTEVLEGKVATNKTIRIGGLVEKGSVQRSPDGLKVDFVVTDLNKKLPVHYEGILPDLFREGQGVVTQGRLQPDNTFVASEVLAKHDEKYMPPEAAQALKGGTFAPGGETKKP
ncbi:MAG: cytochrome c maturation protein CcmE [Pseudomonadota bacterium]